MKNDTKNIRKGITAILLISVFVVLSMAIPGVQANLDSTIEVSQPIQVTSNSYYERGQSIVYDGTNYWMFYGRHTSFTGNYDSGNPDDSNYALYYKKASSIAGLASAEATQISDAGVNIYQGQTSAAYFDNKVWVFAAQQVPSSAIKAWTTTDGSSWTTVDPSITVGTPHQWATVWDSKLVLAYCDGSMIKIRYTTDGTTWTQGANVVNKEGMPRLFADDGTLYCSHTTWGNPGEYWIYKLSGNLDTENWATTYNIHGGVGWFPCDPYLEKVGTDYLFFSADMLADCSRQYIQVFKSSTVAGFDGMSASTMVTNGGSASDASCDMWPVVVNAGSSSYLFYTSERGAPIETISGTGNIWYFELDWNTDNDHYDYIQPAIDAATGTTITVAAGTYTEAITIDKELTLLGATSTECKKDFVLPIALGGYDASTQSVIKAPAPYGGSNAQDNPNTVTITSSNVVLKGFVIEALDRDWHKGNDYNNLVELRPTADTMTGITIENNVIGPNMGQETPRVNGRHGVRLTASGKTISAQITCNKIHGTHGNGNNVFIWGTALGTTPTLPAADLSGTVIENNDICYSARSGIEFSGAQAGATIANNRIHDNGAGYIGDDTDLKWGNGIMFVRDFVDVVHGSDPGLGASAGYVDGVTITDNEIYDNDKNGIYMGPMNKNHVITGNDIHDNGNSARGSGSTFGPCDGIRIDLEGWYYSGSWFGGPYANALYGSTSNIVANCNNIEDNVGYGAQVVGIPTNSFVLDAKCNWWGDTSGPNGVGPGTGDAVSTNVDFDPWIASLIYTGAPQPTANVVLEATLSDSTPAGMSGYTVDFYIDNVYVGNATTDSNGVASCSIGSYPVGIYDVYASVCCLESDPALLAIYDPAGGFVTGGGWINSPAGAYVPDPYAEGKANFGFVSKYKKGQQTPTGNTEFQFKAGDLNFHSDSYDWLLIAGSKAKYKGTGTINGEGSYKFMLSAIDEKLTPSPDDVDMFRIKIWWEDAVGNENIVYDNQPTDPDALDQFEASTVLGGGQIVIHKAK